MHWDLHGAPVCIAAREMVSRYGFIDEICVNIKIMFSLKFKTQKPFRDSNLFLKHLLPFRVKSCNIILGVSKDKTLNSTYFKFSGSMGEQVGFQLKIQCWISSLTTISIRVSLISYCSLYSLPTYFFSLVRLNSF